MAGKPNSPVIEMRKVCKAFAKPSGESPPVLADIDLTLHEGEILGLLGRSGSGKSTLLRIGGGLITPTSGDVLYRGEPLSGPAEGIAVVFQSFALFPWLTVLENVEAGLDALGLAHDEANRRATSAIDLIGLDGFQSAYPRELSGGMRQRVGFARAIVIQPVLLLMDEPFSALDVLTAETLRTDFLRSLDRASASDQVGAAGNSQYRRSSDDVRPNPRPFRESRSYRGRDPGSVAASTQPIGGRVS